ncbi:hypothetical protein NP233_g9751 [Leucocoprinus birnbaumii]|uniref:NAD(P)-binding protein n=1 Tax=Leucocoprinus birnbaumii TaxID=56174 RepID=A0AAD5VJM4_9AGAR|nr:hypothetical protein NP233_g9751 [Leucocoprinus birnbaumii]
MGQTWSQTFPPAPKFSVEQVQDLSGKVTVVTGGNTGIGKEIVRVLLSRNAKVYMASRNAVKARAAIAELKEGTGKEAVYLELDLASLNSVRKAAEEFLSKEQELHALFNNGGLMFLAEAAHSLDVTEDGYDIQWGTNALGPFYFTQLLMPALLNGFKNSGTKSRVVFTSSIVVAKGINFNTLRDTPERKKLSPDQRYGQSKLANIIMAQEIAQRYGAQGIVATSLDPGGAKTDLQQHMAGWARSILNLMLHPPAKAALTPLYAGVAGPDDLNGKVNIKGIEFVRNQTVLTPSCTDQAVVVCLMDIYLGLFRDVFVAEPEKNDGGADNEEKEGSGVVEEHGAVVKDKKGHVIVERKHVRDKMKSQEVVEHSISKPISSSLMGVKRAIPFAKIEPNYTMISAHLDAQFLITHDSTCNTSLQVLVPMHPIALILSELDTTTSNSSSTASSTHSTTLCMTNVCSTKMMTKTREAMTTETRCSLPLVEDADNEGIIPLDEIPEDPITFEDSDRYEAAVEDVDEELGRIRKQTFVLNATFSRRAD